MYIIKISTYTKHGTYTIKIGYTHHFPAHIDLELIEGKELVSDASTLPTISRFWHRIEPDYMDPDRWQIKVDSYAGLT